MIPRTAAATVQRQAKGFPVIAVTGPRQSGKTTLAKAVFANKTYVSLENPDEHEFAERDPRAFLNRFASGAILDEVQRCPHLLSWLKGLVDERSQMGDFVLKHHATHGVQQHPSVNLDNPEAARMPYGLAMAAGALFCCCRALLGR